MVKLIRPQPNKLMDKIKTRVLTRKLTESIESSSHIQPLIANTQ